MAHIDSGKPRAGCRDIWNSFMVEGVKFCEFDMPYCPTTALSLPNRIVTWVEAKDICRRMRREFGGEFHVDAFVCFYLDDFKFDSSFGIWRRPDSAMKTLRHFTGIFTPDLSINQDFPLPWKIFNTYRARAFGCWCASQGLEVINNVRWGGRETWGFCFAGVPRNSIVAIGTVASGLRRLENRLLFEDGLRELVRVLNPHTIIVYGSSNYACFEKLSSRGIRVVQYDSAAARRFAKAGV